MTVLTLLSRLERFRDIIAQTVISDRSSAPLPLEAGIDSLCQQLEHLRERRGQLYIIGNGGSAGVAAHAVTDFFNVARLRASTLHESSLLTCMANDYGYENAFSRMLSQMLSPEDMLVAISSSGNSANIRNAVAAAREIGVFTVSLSGFQAANPLRAMGDVNVWLDSHDYGFVEIGHQFILHNLADRFNEKLKG
ncbi:SIS domain-containing protein [Herbaspirillum huttiense]|uniref:SIS domain-containing protein n=1 Tax=Herbaspirillum huttiense TaxID=863372 RepID=UPI002176EFBD|nr:SIS domain-containing protein [Herbaspirillum huttiense]UWE16083.1 SIS domain-containing protein [Herbaspirillum huttiense]